MKNSPIRSEEHKIEDSPTLGSDDFEKPEEAKPTLKYRIRNVFQKIKVSKTETEKPEIMPKEIEQTATEVLKEEIEDKFHGLIEQEISLLNQKELMKQGIFIFRLRI